MLEIVIGVVSLAIAIGQVYGGPKKALLPTVKIASVAGCGLIACVAGYQFFQDWRERERERVYEQRIETIALRILGVMDKPTTFDNIYARLNFPIYEDADKAFDRLYETGRSTYEPVKLTDPRDGREHTVRLFSRNTKSN